MTASRGPSAWVGGSLVGIALDAGLVDVEHTSATHTWTEWDPDTEPGPPGLFPMRAALRQLAETGRVTIEQADRLVDELEDRARRGRLFMSLTMFAVSGRCAPD